MYFEGKTMKERVLVIAPHLDDEILGCGGSAARFVEEGKEVHVVFVTKGREPLYSEKYVTQGRQEAKKAHLMLGVAQTHFLDFPAAELDSVLHRELNLAIANILQKIKPGIVFTPFVGDVHLDHKLTFWSTLVAVRPTHNYKVSSIYAYETLSETNWNAPYLAPAFTPNVFIDITKSLHKKLAAFKCYKNQVKEPPHERSLKNLKCLAELRGAQINCEAAEAFVLIRSIL